MSLYSNANDDVIKAYEIVEWPSFLDIVSKV